MNPTITEPQPLPHDEALATFAATLKEVIAALYPDAPQSAIGFEAPRNPQFGDFATNAAFSLTRIAKRSPQDIASALVATVLERRPQLRESFAEITPTAGFINLRLAPQVWQGGAWARR